YVTRARARLLAQGSDVTIDDSRRTIVRRAGTEQRPILRLQGVEDRDAVERLRGRELMVDAQQAPTLGEGEWWAHELEGCAVFDGERSVGEVQRLVELPSCEALEVRRAEGGAVLLVPMVKDAIRSIDVTARRIDVDLSFLGVEGLQA
ncbi:MAG TPA: ribosome maturation factor RimM, partial [Solirubrobacteraceae bacterium]